MDSCSDSIPVAVAVACVHSRRASPACGAVHGHAPGHGHRRAERRHARRVDRDPQHRRPAASATVVTDAAGQYVAASLAPGHYAVIAHIEGFKDQTRELELGPAQTAVAQPEARASARIAENVTVTGASPLIETATVSVGQVMAERTVQEIPLNGRHFVDLGPLMPGGVTSPQNAGLSAPLRGQGAFSFFSAGNRETVGQLHGQRHQPERPVEQPGDVPAVDQHGLRVQGRQLDLQRRVRPQLRRDRQRRDAVGRQPDARRRRSTSTATTSSTRATTSTPSRTRSRRSTASSSASISAGRSSRTRRSTSSATKGCAISRASTSTPASLTEAQRAAVTDPLSQESAAVHPARQHHRRRRTGAAAGVGHRAGQHRPVHDRRPAQPRQERRPARLLRVSRRISGRSRTRRATPCPASATRAAASGR